MPPHLLRAAPLALALAILPACESLPGPRFENPIAAARSADHAAYALIETYAAVLEEAADLVADPATSPVVRQRLVEAERIATPAADIVRTALSAYLHARADYEALGPGRPEAERAVSAVAIAAVRLEAAIAQARAPLAALQSAITRRKRA